MKHKPTNLVQSELKHKHYNKPTTQFQRSVTLSPHAVDASGVSRISEPDADVAARLGHNQTCHMCVCDRVIVCDAAVHTGVDRCLNRQSSLSE